MKSNQGFSYIELMVVVAILAVSLTLVSLSVNTVFSVKAKESAHEISSLISKCRITTLSSAEPVYLKIYRDSGGVFVSYHGDGDDSPVKVGASGVGF
jgi:prepilin-type N-terminal cleavage/methylation domain-containing protein